VTRSDDVSVELLGRAGLRYQHGPRTMTIDSEILAGSRHSMCVYRDSIVRWDSPHDADPVTEADRARIIDDIRRFVLSRGYPDIEVV
jgi:hypothetical protein